MRSDDAKHIAPARSAHALTPAENISHSKKRGSPRCYGTRRRLFHFQSLCDRRGESDVRLTLLHLVSSRLCLPPALCEPFGCMPPCHAETRATPDRAATILTSDCVPTCLPACESHPVNDKPPYCTVHTLPAKPCLARPPCLDPTTSLAVLVTPCRELGA